MRQNVPGYLASKSNYKTFNIVFILIWHYSQEFERLPAMGADHTPSGRAAPAYAPSPLNRRNLSRHRGDKGNDLFTFLFENREVANPESTSRTFRIRAKAEVRDIGKRVHVG